MSFERLEGHYFLTLPSLKLSNHILISAFLLLLVSPVFAGDTIYVQSETYTGVAPDTFKLQDQPKAVDDDILLLQLIAQQSQQLVVRDSIRRDSLLADLHLRDSMLQVAMAQLQEKRRVLQDSIHVVEQMPINRATYAEKEEQKAEQQLFAIMDSSRLEVDSILRRMSDNIYLPKPVIEKSIFKDYEADLEDIARSIRDRYSHWYKEANLMLQFTQNYISPNWYKGGKSQFSVLNIAKGQISYRRDPITWDNYGEWRVGITTTPGDTLRKYNVTDDMFRLYSKFGYKIIPKLFAVASVELNTTLWNVWNENQTTAKTAFMTPLKFHVYGGLDYRPINDLSIFVAPVTYKLVYAYFGDGDKKRNIDVTNYGIAAGEHLRNDLGTTIRVQWQWHPVREFGLDTDFYFFTNYHDVEIDWEINGEFYINRFLSIRLMLHPRFDSAYIATGDTKPHIQFKELLSVGFSHKFR